MATHALKIWPEMFAAVRDGRKTYAICHSDRPFAVGDRLLLREWDPAVIDRVSHRDALTLGYTGRSLLVEVTYITPGGTWGLPAGMCVMAIRKVEAPPCACVDVPSRHLDDDGHLPRCPAKSKTL